MTPSFADSSPFEMLVHCIQGFCLLSTASDFGENAGSSICMLFLEEARLASWVSKRYRRACFLHASDIHEIGTLLSSHRG